jgi:hypothetical protein
MLHLSKTFNLALLLTLFSPHALAHNVEVTGEIAGTWHVEPDHNPKAGESAKVWVALTRKGGEVLPFDQANCQMAVFEQPHVEGTQPVLQPQLKAIAADQYKGIPGTELVFPKPGLYEMELSCTPKTEGAFAAFEISSEVTVSAGVAQPSPPAAVPTETLEPAKSEASNGYGLAIWGLGVTTAILLILRVILTRSKKP